MHDQSTPSIMETRPLNLYILSDALLDVSVQLSIVFISWIDWVFTEHLLVSNIVSAALLLGLADFSIQTLEIFVFKTQENFESTRNYRSMQVGMVLGVFNHLWYAFLESYLQGTGLTTVFKKIAFDQAVAGPFFSSAFLVGMGLLEGKSTAEVYAEWSQKFIHIYMVDWLFWPLAQFINFHLVPYRFRVFYVNFATFLWNTFLCYAKHHSEELIKKHLRVRCTEKTPNSLDCYYHESLIEDTERNNSKSSNREKVASPLPKPRSRARKSSRSKQGSLASYSRNSTRLMLPHSSRTLKLPAPKLSRAADNKANTVQSIISIKKMLPIIKLGPNLNESKTNFKAYQERSWVTENCDVCTTPAQSCSTSGSSTNSAGSYRRKASNTSSVATTTPSATANKLFMARESTETQHVKIPTIKKVGMFAEVDAKKASCVQGISARQKLETRTPLGLRAISEARRKISKLEAAAVPSFDSRKQSLADKSAHSVRTLRSHQVRPARTTAQTLADICEALQDLKDLMARGQQEVHVSLANTQEQVSRLQELCAVTYVSVDDGTRELAQKADQLASWVQEEREFKVEQIKTMMEEVFTSRQG